MSMRKDIDVHPVQARILRELLFKREAAFAELNVLGLTTDHFTFHLRSLVEANLLEKTGKGYRLTAIGKEFANRFNTDDSNVVYEKQAKIAVLCCGVRKEGRVIKYLFQQRLKQPYFGYLGFVTGKVRKGDTVLETAKREFLEETGLSGKFRFCGVEHKIDFSSEGELLEDKFFYVFLVENTSGTLIENFEGGKNKWLAEKEARKDGHLFPDVGKLIKMVKKKTQSFLEDRYQAAGF